MTAATFRDLIRRRTPSTTETTARPAGATASAAGPGSSIDTGESIWPDVDAPAGRSPGEPTQDAGLWQAVGDRVLSILADWIAAECRETVERRLAAIQPMARTALLPSDVARTELAGTVFDNLTEAAICGLLSPAIETERRLLLRLAASVEPMLREASLDALCGHPREAMARRQVQEACRTFLAPGLALLGAGPDPDEENRSARSGANSPTANEAVFMEAMRRHDFDDVVSILAGQSGVAAGKVREAVWTRDARSLLGLAWRAGYSVRAARLLQIRLAGIPPNVAIGQAGAPFAPMGRGEVAWQLALLAAS